MIEVTHELGMTNLESRSVSDSLHDRFAATDGAATGHPPAIILLVQPVDRPTLYAVGETLGDL